MLECFPSGSTCDRRFSRGRKAGAFRQILGSLAGDLEARGQFDLPECFSGGLFVVAKKGGPKSEGPGGAKVRCTWSWLSLTVFHLPCARLLRHYKRSFFEANVAECVIAGRRRRLIGDRADNSDPHDEKRTAQGINLIAHALSRPEETGYPGWLEIAAL